MKRNTFIISKFLCTYNLWSTLSFEKSCMISEYARKYIIIADEEVARLILNKLIVTYGEHFSYLMSVSVCNSLFKM